MLLSRIPFLLEHILALLLCMSFSAGVFAGTTHSSEFSEPSATEVQDNFQDESEQKVLAIEKATKQEQFLMLQKAFSEQRFNSLSPEQTSLDDFILQDYVSAWSILTRAKISKISPSLEQEGQQFLQKHQGQYIAERFRTDWLKLIASQLHEENRWGEFESLRKQLIWNYDEADFQCWQLYHTLTKTNTPNRKQLTNIEQKVLNLLKNPRFSKLEICKKLSRTMIEIIPSSAFARTLVLIQQGQIQEAKEYVLFLIKQRRLQPTALLALEKPHLWYEKFKTKIQHQDKYAALIAAYQLSRNDYQKAAQLTLKLNPRLSKREKNALWGRLGYVAALNHDPKALLWYSKGEKEVCYGPYMAHPEACLEWRIRTALRQSQWEKVVQLINQLPGPLKEKDVWHYWKGYALKQQGFKSSAEKEFQKLTNVRTFYGKLAAEQLKQRIVYRTNGTTVAPKERVDLISKDQSIQRAQAFYELSLLHYGHREWNWGIRNAAPWDLLAAAQWAQQNNLWHRMINTAERVAERMPIDHDLLYPRPYRALIENYAKVNNIRNDWVYGLIRQESRFISMAQSPVGANGLMQIMPATAQWIAQNLQDLDFKPESIYEAETNIRFGTAYLRSLLDRLDQNIILATAGYNAGPNRAKTWRSTLNQPIDGAIFIETIPFTETRSYVQNVLANMVEYSQQGEHPIKSLFDIIGSISPKPIDREENI